MNWPGFDFSIEIDGSTYTTQWNNGLNEAINRMKEHIANVETPIRFDARDRSALAFMIYKLEHYNSLRKMLGLKGES